MLTIRRKACKKKKQKTTLVVQDYNTNNRTGQGKTDSKHTTSATDNYTLQLGDKRLKYRRFLS